MRASTARQRRSGCWFFLAVMLLNPNWAGTLSPNPACIIRCAEAHKYSGMKVREILNLKKGSIRQAPLDPGSPSWDDILDYTWEQIEAGASARRTGFQTFHKLLTDRRFDK